MRELPLFDKIERKAFLSKDGKYRWTLERNWGIDAHRVCFVMLNPSTADALKDDPTICRCMKFARSWGYDGIVVVNLYPFRSSSPSECRIWADWERNGPDWYARDFIHYNEGIVAEIAKISALVIASWGSAVWAYDQADRIVEEIQSGVAPYPDMYCLGLTKDGHPKHPLARGIHRIPDNQRPILWRTA